MNELNNEIAAEANRVLSRICRLEYGKEEALETVRKNSSLQNQACAWAEVVERVETALALYADTVPRVLAAQPENPELYWPGPALHAICGNWQTPDRANLRKLVYREFAAKRCGTCVPNPDGTGMELVGQQDALMHALEVFGEARKAVAVVIGMVRANQDDRKKLNILQACNMVACYENAL